MNRATRGTISVKGAVLAAVLTAIACFAMLAAGASNANASFNVTDFDMSPSTPSSTTNPLQAGGHPTVNFRINPDANLADGSNGDDLKKVMYEFPAGSLGNPEAAVPKCTASQFNSDKCPSSSYIGSLSVKLRIRPLWSYTTLTAPGSMYILDPPTPGSAVTVGFIVRPPGYRLIFLKSEVKGVVSVRNGLDANYGLDFTVDNIPRVLQTTWGSNLNATIQDLTVVLNHKTKTDKSGPFFTYAPTRCDASLVRATLTSYAGVSQVKNDSYTTTGCSSVPFTPTASVNPSTLDANAPANWAASFTVPTAAANIQNSHIRSISVDLPPSTQLNYAELANLTTVCSEAQINADSCPSTSRIGTVSAHVPFLPGASPNFNGEVYLLSKTSGVTFGYIVRGPNGVTAQVRGWIQPVDVTGDGNSDLIRTYSENMPQAPFSPANISFDRPLVLNPINCGAQPVKTTITGWSGASWTQSVNKNFVCTGPATPDTAIIAPTVPNPTNDNTPTFSFSATPSSGATFEVSVDGSTFAAAAGTSYTTATLSDGSHTFRVRACNAAAITPCDATPASQTFVVDTVAPSLTIGSPTAGQLINSTAVGVSFFSSDSSATMRCKLDSNADAACTSPANYTGLSQGSHTVQVTATDPAGNQTVRSVTFTVDSQAPTGTATCAANSPVASSASCSFSFNEPVTNVTCTSSAGATDTSCVSPKIYSSLANGTYSFSVSGTDAAGNVGTAVAPNFTINVDTTGPVTTINSGPSGAQSSRTATYTFSADESATFYCSLDGAPATVCVSGVSYTSLVDGPHSFAVYGIDGSSNQGATVTRNFSVDGTAPATPSLTRTSPTSTPTSQTTATLTVTGVEAGGIVQYSSNGGTTWTTGTNPLNLTGLTNGTTYTYIARVQDAAGNNSAASSSVSWTVDTTAPAAPTLARTSPTSTPTNQTTATLTASGVEAGGIVQYSTNGGTTWTTGTNPLNLTGLTNGTYTYIARVQDAAGNNSAASSSVSWTVDTAPPAAPTVTRQNPTANPTASTTQDIVIGGVEAGATVACTLDSVAYTPCAAGTISLSGLSSATHTFSVIQTDTAGNAGSAGSVVWTVDAGGVNAPTISAGPAAGSFVSSTSASFSFSSTTPSVTYECKLEAAGTYSACTSPQAYTSLTQGSHTFFVRAKNGVGTLSSETTRQWTVDTVAPAAPTLTRTAPASTPTNSTNATLTPGGVEAGGIVQYSSNGGTTWTTGTNPLNLTGLTNGTTYTYIARVQDAAGNNSAASSSVSWTVDTAPPAAPTVTRQNPTANPTASTTQDIVIGGVEAGATVACTLDSVAYTPCAAGTISLSGLSSATHTFSVIQTDTAGNAGSAGSVVWTVDAGGVNAPTISAGPAAGSFVSSTSASFSFSSTTPSVTYECKLEAAGTYSACTSPQAYTSLTQGSHTFFVRAKNGVGTLSSETTRQWTVDTVAPAAPTLTRTAPASTPTNSTNATLTPGGVEAGGIVQYSSNGGTTWTTGTNPLNLTGLTNGTTYTYIARVQDAAGNNSAASSSVSWTVDTAPPAAPTVTRQNPTANPTASTTQDIVIGGVEAGATVACTLDSVAYTPCAAGTISLSGLSSATHTFSVIQTDTAGNAGSAGSVVWTVDAGGVNAPTISAGPAAGSFVSSTSASFSFSSTTPSVTYECKLEAAGTYSACTSPQAYTSLTQGSHTFFVRAKNGVGTLSSETTRQWTVDTGIPANPGISLDSPATSPTQSRNASISFTGEASATFFGRLDSASFAVVTSPVALSSLADGNHTYTVYQVDQAGNTSGTVQVAWTVDNAAPAVPTLTRTAPASTPTNSTTATLTAGNVEAGGTVEYSSNGGTTWTAGANPLNLSGLTNGTYTYVARVTDAAGNTSAASSAVSWVVDTVAPVAPSVTGPSGTTALQTASISFTGEAGATFGCSLDGGASPTFTPCTSPQNLSGLANGPHTYDVRQTDTAGNVGPAQRISWTVDTSAFTASILTGPSGTIATTTAAFTYTATITSGTTFECGNVVGTTAPTTFTTCPNAGQSYTGLVSGTTYTFAVRAKNGAQTTPAVPRTYTIDTTPPTVTPTNPGTTGPSGSIAFSATDATSPVTTNCALDGGASTSCSGSYAFSGLTNGAHQLVITAMDGVGNSGTTPVNWTVDAIAPDTSISGTPASPTSSKSASLTLSSTEPSSTFQCNVDGGGYNSCTSPLALSALAEGAHTVLARATDQYGNQDATPASASWTVDSIAPAVPTLTRTSPTSTPTSQTTATLTVTGVEAGGIVQYSSNGGTTWTTGTNPLNLTGLTNGTTYTYIARVQDAAGNNSAASSSVSWTVDTTAPAAPTLARTSPTSTPTNQTTATLTASGVEAGGIVQYSTNGGTTWTTGANPLSLSGLTDGTYTYIARVQDAAGNNSAA
ncbi:MAG: hypothetical protein JHC98_08830, partial [Thermoleophilaceae bacterium]|nr:hypothetical protein [Thermoleophilaceae bacterium]